MINLKILSAAAVLTLALPVIDSTASYAQGGHGHGGGARGGGGGAHMGTGGGGPRMGMGGGRHYSGGGGRYYRGGGGGGFVPGLIAGGIIGGALAAPYAYGGYGYGGYGYGGYGPYAGNAYYAAPPAYDYDDESVEVEPGGGDVDYCIRTFKSYNVRTGTYLGYDGLRHACP